MSDALSHHARLKPDIRLAQAISEFATDLPEDQKKEFRSLSRSHPPTTGDVMRLTAEIDQRKLSKVGMKCFGPRMTNFLHAVQQFAAIGDVVVGGSQNIIACGVWAVVRMSLLSLVNVSSYLEKLSALFMTIGRTAPRNEMIRALYPQSPRLQANLAEYFIIVVHLCDQIVKFTQKSFLGKFSATLSDAQLKSFQSDLDVWATSIREEVTLLMAQRIESEARENSRFRLVANKLAKTTENQRQLIKKVELLKLCSEYDYETPWRQTRKLGVSKHFIQSDIYNKWKKVEEGYESIAFIGKLGSGKSVVLANIVDDLNLFLYNDANNADNKVAFFFCRHDIAQSLTAKTIIGSIFHQFLRQLPDQSFQQSSTELSMSTFDFEKVLCVLEASGLKYRIFYIILDGLDELIPSEREVLYDQLRILRSRIAIRVCMSQRTGPYDASHKDESKALGKIHTVFMPDENREIDDYIDIELERCLESGRLQVGNPELVLDIRNALVNGSQGMFLWVSLQISSLCMMKTDESIRHALLDNPGSLSPLFSRILKQSADEHGHQFQATILRLVSVAQHPLTTEQLREALGVVPGDKEFNSGSIPNNIFDTLACCGCLLTVDEEELTVRFVHKSVKIFLTWGSTVEWLHGEPRESLFLNEAHELMLDVIATYLSYDAFETRVSRNVVPCIQGGTAPSAIVHATMDNSKVVKNLTLKLLRARKAPDINIGKVLAEAAHKTQKNQWHFRSYATSNWHYHAMSVKVYIGESRFRLSIIDSTHDAFFEHLCDSKSVWRPLLHLLQEGRIDAGVLDADQRTLLSASVFNGHRELVTLLLKSGDAAQQVHRADRYGNTPFISACIEGHADIVEALITLDVRFFEYKDVNKRTPLFWAARYGQDQVAKVLIRYGHDINAVDKNGNSPKSIAARSGHNSVAGTLTFMNSWKDDEEDIFDRAGGLAGRMRNIFRPKTNVNDEIESPVLGSRIKTAEEFDEMDAQREREVLASRSSWVRQREEDWM